MILFCADTKLNGQVYILDMHQLCDMRHESCQQSMSTQDQHLPWRHEALQTDHSRHAEHSCSWEACITAIVVALARIQPASSTMVARTYTMVA